MMKRKIIRVGNSLVVSLPKDAIELLGVDEGSEVNIKLDWDTKHVIILPPNTMIEDIDEEFVHQVHEFIEEYRPVLLALVKGERNNSQ
jgi:putative addiction module antidote